MLEADDAWLALCADLKGVSDLHLMRWDDGRHVARVRVREGLVVPQWSEPEMHALWEALMWYSGFVHTDLMFPQHTALRLSYRQGSLRLAYAPMALGQRLVVRMHMLQDPCMYATVSPLVVEPGLCLLYGRTGSGKTTRAYAYMTELHEQYVVVSVEDPPESLLGLWPQFDRRISDDEGIHKLVLRHNPDVLFWGEVRDASAWAMLANWVTSGHLVVTTIHAESSEQCLDRLELLGAGRDFLRRYVLRFERCVR